MKRGFLIRAIVGDIVLMALCFAFYMIFYMGGAGKTIQYIFTGGILVGGVALPILVVLWLLKFVFGTNPKNERS